MPKGLNITSGIDLTMPTLNGHTCEGGKNLLYCFGCEVDNIMDGPREDLWWRVYEMAALLPKEKLHGALTIAALKSFQADLIARRVR